MLLNGNVLWVIWMVIMDSDIKMTRLTMMVMMMMMILTMMMVMIMVMLMMAIMVMTMLSKLLITHCFPQDHMNDQTISPLCLTQRGPPWLARPKNKQKKVFTKEKGWTPTRPTWRPFYCLGTTNWRMWRHVWERDAQFEYTPEPSKIG